MGIYHCCDELERASENPALPSASTKLLCLPSACTTIVQAHTSELDLVVAQFHREYTTERKHTLHM